MYYYIKIDGSEYVRTKDALLASNLFSSLIQQRIANVTLYFGGRLFADSESMYRIKEPNNMLPYGRK